MTSKTCVDVGYDNMHTYCIARQVAVIISQLLYLTACYFLSEAQRRWRCIYSLAMPAQLSTGLNKGIYCLIGRALDSPNMRIYYVGATLPLLTKQPSHIIYSITTVITPIAHGPCLVPPGS